MTAIPPTGDFNDSAPTPQQRYLTLTKHLAARKEDTGGRLESSDIDTLTELGNIAFSSQERLEVAILRNHKDDLAKGKNTAYFTEYFKRDKTAIILAEQYYAEALDINPNHKYALQRYCRCLRKNEKTTEAQKVAIRIIAADNGKITPIHAARLGQIYEEIATFSLEALALETAKYEREMTRTPPNPFSFEETAEIYYIKASQAYEYAHRHAPDNNQYKAELNRIGRTTGIRSNAEGANRFEEETNTAVNDIPQQAPHANLRQSTTTAAPHNRLA